MEAAPSTRASNSPARAFEKPDKLVGPAQTVASDQSGLFFGYPV